MTDQYYDKVSSDLDPFKKILSVIPGFKGYIERQKVRFRQILRKRSPIASINSGSAFSVTATSTRASFNVDDLEAAAIKLRTFIDRIRRARRGYSGLFDAEKINEKELLLLYQYDAALLEMSDQVASAIDNVEASIGSDGLPAAIRNLTSVSQQCIDAYNRRDEAMRAQNPA
jgi:hypothetical protein